MIDNSDFTNTDIPFEVPLPETPFMTVRTKLLYTLYHYCVCVFGVCVCVCVCVCVVLCVCVTGGGEGGGERMGVGCLTGSEGGAVSTNR